jgi:ATP-binding cassette subfamily F protein 3
LRLTQEEAREDYSAAAATHQALEACDGYGAERRARQLMLGLGFEEKDCGRRYRRFPAAGACVWRWPGR